MRKTGIQVSAAYKRAAQVKIPQQTTDIDCGLVPLFFSEGFLREPERFIEKATAKETSWDFRRGVRAATYQRLEAFVDGDEGDNGDWVSDGDVDDDDEVDGGDEVDDGDVDDEEVDDEEGGRWGCHYE